MALYGNLQESTCSRQGKKLKALQAIVPEVNKLEDEYRRSQMRS